MSNQTNLNVILDQYEERANAATPGPWEAKSHGVMADGSPNRYHLVSGGQGAMLLTHLRVSDAKFLSASRTDIPALVKALRELWDKYTDAVGRGATEEYYLATVNEESANLAAILQASSEPKRD